MGANNFADAVSISADTTPVVITSTLSAVKEYMLIFWNAASVGGVTAYVAASATDNAVNALALPPQKGIISGPYSSLPFLYAASTRAIKVNVLGYGQPTNRNFQHTDVTVTPNQLGDVREVVTTVTAAANAGATVVATAAGGAVRVLAVNIVSDGVTTADLTSAEVTAGAAGAIKLISTTTAAKANIDAADEQVSYDGGEAGVILDAADTVSMDLQGGGATAVALTVYTKYSAITDGASMS